jgi:uncharacterized protein YkwD
MGVGIAAVEGDLLAVIVLGVVPEAAMGSTVIQLVVHLFEFFDIWVHPAYLPAATTAMAFLRVALISLAAALLIQAPSARSAGPGLDHQRRVEPVARPSHAGPLVAPPAACPGQERLDLAPEAMVAAMACLTNYARGRAGIGGLEPAPGLGTSAGRKASDILACDSFSHFACGREFSYWIRAEGYMSAPCWRVGENIAFGQGGYGTARAIFTAWLRSLGHRNNILGRYHQVGIGLRTGRLGTRTGTRIWVQHFVELC